MEWISGIQNAINYIEDHITEPLDYEAIARRVIRDAEGENVSREVLDEYANPDSDRYRNMLDAICAQLGFTTLNYNRLDDLVKAIGLSKDQVCTYCWDGKE